MKTAAFSMLNVSRTEEREKDDKQVAELLAEGTLNVDQRFNKKYMEGIARGIGWKVGRLEKTVERTAQRMKAIAAAIERAKLAKEKKNEDHV